MWIRMEKFGNVSDVLLKFQYLTNQKNTNDTKPYFPLLTIEISVFKAYNALFRVRGEF